MQEVLRDFGLNENETEVYLALVKLKEQTAPRIAKYTKINKSTVYLELDKLIQKGLASFVVRNKVKYFKPASPNKFLDILDDKKEKMKEIIPKLNSLTTFERPNLTVYEGKEGLKTALLDILNENKEVVVFGACGNIFKTLEYNFPNLLAKFLKSKIKARYIINDNYKEFDKKFPKSIAKIKHLNIKSKAATIIYGNKVAIQSLEENPFSAIIEDKNLADSYRNYFEFMWKSIAN